MVGIKVNSKLEPRDLPRSYLALRRRQNFRGSAGKFESSRSELWSNLFEPESPRDLQKYRESVAGSCLDRDTWHLGKFIGLFLMRLSSKGLF